MEQKPKIGQSPASVGLKKFYSGFLWLFLFGLVLIVIFVLIVAVKFKYMTTKIAAGVFLLCIVILFLIHKLTMKKLSPLFTKK